MPARGSGECLVHPNRADDAHHTVERIMDVAREQGLKEIDGLVLVNNPGMLKLMKALGFSIQAYPEDPDFKLVTHAL